MKIKSISGEGSFRLIKNNQEICELIYNNCFSGIAKTDINGNYIEIKPKNIWRSKVKIYKNDKNIGDITFSLKGYMVIRLQISHETEINYVMINQSKSKLKFEVFDESENLQFTLKSKNNWNKLNYDYDIEMDRYNNEIWIEELLIYCGYAANLYLAIISAV